MHITCKSCKRRIRIRNERKMNCICGYELSHRQFYGESDKFLIDANILLYALNNDWKFGESCKLLLSMHQGALVTTGSVLAEIRQECEYQVKAYDVKDISPEVAELRYGDETNELSRADKSLIQCAIDHAEIGGIISYDADIRSVVPSSLIESEKQFFVGTADEFLKKKNGIEVKKWKKNTRYGK